MSTVSGKSSPQWGIFEIEILCVMTVRPERAGPAVDRTQVGLQMHPTPGRLLDSIEITEGKEAICHRVDLTARPH